MSKTIVEFTCDGCGNDLTDSANCADYRLALVNERIPSRGGFVATMGAYPAIDRDVHFCNVNCLREWFDREYPAGKVYSGGRCWARYHREEREKAAAKTDSNA